MSHITHGKLAITSLDALDKACSQCGVRLVRGQKTYKTFAGTTSRCQHAIVLPGSDKAYEIGVLKASTDANGNLKQDANGDRWMLGFDDFNGGRGMMSKVETNCNTLMQSYGVEAAKEACDQQGWTWEEQTLEDGTIRLEVNTDGMDAGMGGMGW